MKSKTLTLLVFVGGLVVISVVAAVIASGVSSRRAARDVQFGIEELDSLLAADAGDEAGAMVRWLSERASTVPEALRILKRARDLTLLTGDAAPFADSAATLSAEFPGNLTLMELAAYAAAQDRREEEALSYSQRLLEAGGDDLLFAWLIAGGTDAATMIPALGSRETAASDATVAGPVALALLSDESRSEEFEQAWVATGRWEYAHLAALSSMRDGDLPRSVRLVDEAELEAVTPVLAYDIHLARGDFASADRAISNADRGEPETALRMADHALYTARTDAARQIYESLASRADGLPYQLWTNLAYLASDSVAAEAYLSTALREYPDAPAVREFAFRFYAENDPARAASVLEQHSADPEHRLLQLRITGDPRTRRFSSGIWELILSEEEPAERDTIARFAAWHFFSEGTTDDLRALLATVNSPDSAFSLYYQGVIAARSGSWETAQQLFEQSFRAEPGAAAAFNDGVALVRLGFLDRARGRMDDAILLAETELHRFESLLAAARLAPAIVEAEPYLVRAAEINPSSARLLLLEQALGSERTRRR